MAELSFVLLNGLVMGSVYALTAFGISLIVGLMRVINFAHGEFYVLGAYLACSLESRLPLHIALPLAFCLVCVLGLAIERIFIRPTYFDPMASMVITFILSVALQNAFLLFFGPYPYKGENFAEGTLHIGESFAFGKQRFYAGVFCLAAYFLVSSFLNHSRFGKAVRAVAQDRFMAESVGIPAAKINSFSFALGAVLAAFAGVLLSPIFPVVPTSGSALTLSSFVVVVLGGLGSLKGCLWGGLSLGLIEGLASNYLSTAYSPIFAFGLLILVLLLRPRGLYGSKI